LLNKLEGASPAVVDYREALAALAEAARRCLHLVKNGVSVIRSTPSPIDWEAVEEAQAAHRRGESILLKPSKADAH
jgi:hypothetical protein